MSTMRDIMRRVQEYSPQDLLLACLIMGLAKIINVRLYLTTAELMVYKPNTTEWKRFDLPIDLAGFPILAEFPVDALDALKFSLMERLRQ